MLRLITDDRGEETGKTSFFSWKFSSGNDEKGPRERVIEREREKGRGIQRDCVKRGKGEGKGERDSKQANT